MRMTNLPPVSVESFEMAHPKQKATHVVINVEPVGDFVTKQLAVSAFKRISW